MIHLFIAFHFLLILLKKNNFILNLIYFHFSFYFFWFHLFSWLLCYWLLFFNFFHIFMHWISIFFCVQGNRTIAENLHWRLFPHWRLPHWRGRFVRESAWSDTASAHMVGLTDAYDDDTCDTWPTHTHWLVVRFCTGVLLAVVHQMVEGEEMCQPGLKKMCKNTQKNAQRMRILEKSTKCSKFEKKSTKITKMRNLFENMQMAPNLQVCSIWNYVENIRFFIKFQKKVRNFQKINAKML